MKPKTLIIAEAGVNHNGDLNLAKKMIDVAKDCGVDIVKFQTGIADKLISKFAEKADYQKQTTGQGESQLDMVKKLLLPQADFAVLHAYCKQQGIVFLSTPFDLESIAFLDSLDMPFWKIPSGEVTNLPYLIAIAKTGKPVVMSTGMCTMDEIRAALDCLCTYGTKSVTLLHCNTEYPTPFEDVNLNAMEAMKDAFQVEIGYSDHTPGIAVPIAAVAKGATVIEKHFTLDRNMAGPDHKASLEPQELKAMVVAIRNVEVALGSAEKTVSPSEGKNKQAARKSITAKRNIKKGEVFSEDNLTTKRPGTGLSPMGWFDVIGTVARRDFAEDELIEL